MARPCCLQWIPVPAWRPVYIPGQRLPGSGALPLPARSCPRDPPGPKNCLLRPQRPTRCVCSPAQGSGGRPSLLEGDTGGDALQSPGQLARPTSQLGQWRRPHQGACVLLTHTCGRREKPWARSPLLTARGTLRKSAWQQDPEARSVCLVPDRRVSEKHLIFQKELPPSEPGPWPPPARSPWPCLSHSPAAAGCSVTEASGRSSRRRPVLGAHLSHTLRPPACN